MIYGVAEDSAYVPIQFNRSSDVYISDAYAEKHGIQTGDRIVLEEPYDDGTYEFIVSGIYDYPSSIAVFMEQQEFNRIFGKREGFFNGYFTDEEITDIKEEYVASVITVDDLDKTCKLTQGVYGRHDGAVSGIRHYYVCNDHLPAVENHYRKECTVDFHDEDSGLYE